jgi:mono/diheme cytochrome c family protein
MKRLLLIVAAVLILTLLFYGLYALAFLGRAHTAAQAGPVRTPLLLLQPIPDSTPNAAQLRRGQYLIRVGDCAACHTPPGGPTLSGGYPLATPFGVIYSTNLTSDPETGVGRLSADQFYAALHTGVGPKGGQIYPAMPYNDFTRISRADSDAMLAYLKFTPPVSAQRPPNALLFPLNFRPLMKGWNLLFFRPGEFSPDPGRSAAWNRGAYLVTGLGHCGACHTAKTVLASDKGGVALQGGNLSDWVAPDLTSNARTGLGAWSVDDVVEYLKTGRNARANAGGPMGEVVTQSTSLMDDQDLRAIAIYLKDLPASPSRVGGRADPDAMKRGEAVYSDACAACHMADGKGQSRTFPPMVGDAMLQQSDPAGLIHLILAGARTGPTAVRPTALSMPSFAWKLTDQEIADVSTYVRNSWGNQAPAVSAGAVRQMRARLDLKTSHPTDGSGDHP